jgi:pyruvate/2-oxoglutarate dehydrogenase complex dihydrolipoamide dehydrogenase (E3) component
MLECGLHSIKVAYSTRLPNLTSSGGPIGKPASAFALNAGVDIYVDTKAVSHASGALVGVSASGPISIQTEKVLVTVGHRPITRGWGLESMGVDMASAYVKVDDRCATSMRNVWAIGDLLGEPMLEHKAAAQGHLVAEIIAGHLKRFNPVAIPAVCFTDPEIVTVGLGPGDLDNLANRWTLAGSIVAWQIPTADDRDRLGSVVYVEPNEAL